MRYTNIYVHGGEAERLATMDVGHGTIHRQAKREEAHSLELVWGCIKAAAPALTLSLSHSTELESLLKTSKITRMFCFFQSYITVRHDCVCALFSKPIQPSGMS
jgi:hypothetical protein